VNPGIVEQMILPHQFDKGPMPTLADHYENFAFLFLPFVFSHQVKQKPDKRV
jgi:hypothetical protein